MKLSELREEYLRTLRTGGLAPRTLQSRSECIQRLIDVVGDKEVTAVTRKDLEDFTDRLVEAGKKDSYIHKIQVNIKYFYSWAVEAHFCERSPFDGFRMRKVRATHRVVDPAAVEKALTYLRIDGDERLRNVRRHWEIAERDGNAWRKLRNWVLGVTSYHCGLRAGEALALQWRDVDFQEQLLRLRVSKTGPREVPITYDNVALLQQWQRLNAPTAEKYPVFPVLRSRLDKAYDYTSWERALKKAGKKAGVNLCTHDLRRAIATKAVNSGVPVDVVRSQLGHTNITTTQRYFTTDQGRVRDYMAEIFGHPVFATGG